MSHRKRLNRRRKVQADKKAKRAEARKNNPAKTAKAGQPKTDKKTPVAAPGTKPETGGGQEAETEQ